MKIERVIVEIPELQRLEKQVDETAAVVADWKRSIAAIETQLNSANLALTRAKQLRESLALNASLGVSEAVAQIKHARSEQNTAEQTIGDLHIALPEAQAQLASAEKAAESARREVAQYHAQQLQRQRVEVAGQLDAAISDFTRLFGEFEKLGNQIANMEAVPRNMHGMADHESAIGLRRVRAAFPKLMDRVFLNTHDETKKEALAVSEARHWNLAPIESNEKAA
jgi:chromosome segregation ATPase